MCNAKPGLRCSAHTRKKLNRLVAWKARNPDSPNIDEKIEAAANDYHLTPGGIKELYRNGEQEKADANKKAYSKMKKEYKAFLKNGGEAVSEDTTTNTKTVTTVKPVTAEGKMIAEAKAAIQSLNDSYAGLANDADGNTPYKAFVAELSDKEIEANRLLLNAGGAVRALADQYGNPSDEDWAEGAAKLKKIRDELAERQNKYRNAEFALRVALKNRAEGTQKMYEELEAERKSVNAATRGFNKGTEFLNVELAARQGQAYRKALEATGVTFSKSDALDGLATPTNSRAKKSVALLGEAATYYPASWVEGLKKSEAAVPVRTGAAAPNVLVAKDSKGNITTTVTIPDNSPSTAVHELGHVMEAGNSHVGNAERVFLRLENENSMHQSGGLNGGGRNALYAAYARRTLSQEYSAKIYASTTRPTHFPNGRQVGRSYEVLTTGMEAMFFGQAGGGRGVKINGGDLTVAKSPQHIDFVLGLLSLKPTGSN